MVGTLLGVGGTLSINFTSNGCDLRNSQLFLGSEITFFHFSPNLLYIIIPMKLSRDIARGKGHLIHELDLNDLDLGKWRPF